jgi:hypothetical protein
MIRALITDSEHSLRDEVVDSLRKAGFLIDRRVGSEAVLHNRLRDGAFDLAFLNWSGPADRDLGVVLEARGERNYGRFQSSQVDALLLRIRQAADAKSRAPLLAELGQQLREAQPLVGLSAPDPRGLVHKRVQGLKVSNGWFFLGDLSLAQAPE